MRKDQIWPSNWITARDLDEPKTLTIKSIRTEVYPDGKQARALSFEETRRELGCNRTNWDAIAEIAGHEDDEMWPGTRIELFQARVEYAGKLVPAVRVRRPDVRELTEEEPDVF